jgi:hypothetical protein
MPQNPPLPNPFYTEPHCHYFAVPQCTCPTAHTPTVRTEALFYGLSFVPLLPVVFVNQTLPTTALPQYGTQVPQPYVAAHAPYVATSTPNMAAPIYRREIPVWGPGPMMPGPMRPGPVRPGPVRPRRYNLSDRSMPYSRPERSYIGSNIPTLEEIEREEEELRHRFMILKGAIPPENAS